MRNRDLDAGGEARGGAAAANGAAAVGRKRRKRKTRRSWSVEEKIRMARESFASGETITAVAQRHGIPRNRLSSWRTQLRRGQLVAPSSAQACVFHVKLPPVPAQSCHPVQAKVATCSSQSCHPLSRSDAERLESVGG